MTSIIPGEIEDSETQIDATRWKKVIRRDKEQQIVVSPRNTSHRLQKQ
jgi:hypothetical protein